MLNHAVLEGFVASDVILKTTTAGALCISISVGIPKKYPDPLDDIKVEYIPVIAFHSLAEQISKNAQKGKIIGITGYFRNRCYQTKDGTKCKVMEVIAEGATYN